MLCMVFTLTSWASTRVIDPYFGATLVCPFNVINGPKLIGNVTVSCYSDTRCFFYLNANYSWGTPGSTPAPTLYNGLHHLSNDAMANVGLNAITGTQSILLQVKNTENTIVSTVCMQATIVGGVFACSGGPYTIDINNL